MLLSALYTPLRIALGDESVAGNWGITDEMALAYLQQPFKLGEAPPYLALTQTTVADDTITPDPNAVETGLIILRSALHYFGPQSAVSWRTRAASYSESSQGTQNILRELRVKLQHLEELGGERDENGNVSSTPLFGGSLDASTFVTDFTSYWHGRLRFTAA